MLSHCCFSLHFSFDIQFRACFYVFICHLYIFFGKVCVKVFGAFFNWVACFLIVEFLEFFIYSRYNFIIRI